MAYVYNSILTDYNHDILIDSEDYILKSEDCGYNTEIFKSLAEYIKNPITTPLFKIIKLHNDESFDVDLTPYVIENTIKYNNQYAVGQRRSLSFDIYNENNRFFPSPVKKDGLWNGDKFMFYMGILVENSVKWFPCGMFVVQTANPSYNDSNIISVGLLDKYALFDGTIGGSSQTELKIPVGTPIKTAIDRLRFLNKNGYLCDSKPIIFPSKYSEAVTPYTLTASPTENIGDLFLKLGEMIACEIYYNELGILVIEPYDLIINPLSKRIMWRYFDEYGNVSMDFDFTKVINKVTVMGSNINGHLCKATIENLNPKSPTNTQLMPTKFSYIAEESIRTDADARVRAEYEIQKNSILTVKISFDSIFIPFLIDNELVEFTNEYITCGGSNDSQKLFNHTLLLLSSISISGDGKVQISATNVKELPF